MVENWNHAVRTISGYNRGSRKIAFSTSFFWDRWRFRFKCGNWRSHRSHHSFLCLVPIWRGLSSSVRERTSINIWNGPWPSLGNHAMSQRVAYPRGESVQELICQKILLATFTELSTWCTCMHVIAKHCLVLWLNSGQDANARTFWHRFGTVHRLSE